MKLKKIIIAPDSYKGTLSSKQAADIISQEVSAVFPNCEIIKIPIADGGEGSTDAIISIIDGKTYHAQVLSPDDKQITANYGISRTGIAVIEMAQSSGITKQTGLHPMTSSTYGFGQLIYSALQWGAKKFILCIGGSASTDGGCGMAAALGVRFFDENGNSFIPCGATLSKIARIDRSGIDQRISWVKITVIRDVDNPLFGEKGAAYVYGPQKGATPEQIRELDDGLRHLGTLLYDDFGKDFAKTPGAGAAGGLGAGCIAFLGAEITSGIDTILRLCSFRQFLSGADLIITGEGKLDLQSFYGKALSGILREAGNVPVWSMCGTCDCNEALLRKYDLTIFKTSQGISIEESFREPEKYLRIAVRKAMNIYRSK